MYTCVHLYTRMHVCTCSCMHACLRAHAHAYVNYSIGDVCVLYLTFSVYASGIGYDMYTISRVVVLDWISCATNFNCAKQCVQNYMKRYGSRCTGKPESRVSIIYLHVAWS